MEKKRVVARAGMPTIFAALTLAVGCAGTPAEPGTLQMPVHHAEAIAHTLVMPGGWMREIASSSDQIPAWGPGDPAYGRNDAYFGQRAPDSFIIANEAWIYTRDSQRITSGRPTEQYVSRTTSLQIRRRD